MKQLFFVLGLIFLSTFSKLAEASPITSVPFAFLDNRIITPVYINGQGPFYMMLDTGATNILSNEAAKLLKLNSYNSFPIEGGGESSVQASYCDVQQVQIGNKALHNSRFICMDFKDMQKAIGFPRLDGFIGYEFLSQFLVEINFDQMKISISNFSEAPAPKVDNQVIPLLFDGGPTPLITAALDGVSGNFLLDTGDRASATLSLPFIKNNSLEVKYNPPFSMMTGFGIGGPLKTSMAFATEIKMTGATFTSPLIRMPVSNSKGLNDPTIAGTLGMGLFRQFNIVIDYSRQRLVLSKNSAFTQDRSFDRSGMWLSLADGGFLINDVLIGGPAWTAGLRANQLILAVDGVPSSKIDLLTLREQLKDRRNDQVVVLIKDKDRNREATISLRDLIAIP